jgi:hypothetical protein
MPLSSTSGSAMSVGVQRRQGDGSECGCMILGIENMTLGIENMTLGKAGGRGSWLRELRSQVYAQLVCNISGEH